MQGMDIFLFPSLYEGLGIALIEAQCSGLKCICSNEVPKEVKLTPLLHFINLKNRNLWEQSILNEYFYERKNSYSLIKSEYEIRVEAKKLLNKYLEIERNVV